MYILELLHCYFIVLCLFDGGARSELSLAENRKAKAHARLTAKWTYFHGFLTCTDGEYTCEM